MGKSYQQLTLQERQGITELYRKGASQRQIATAMDRAPSTISREIARNTNSQQHYQPAIADERAWARCWRGNRLTRDSALRELVLQRLAQGFSPEQIAGRLAYRALTQQCSKQQIKQVSDDTIYRFIYAQIARTKDYRWRHYLPRGKTKRGDSRRASTGVSHIKHRVSIDARPELVQQRTQVGHWEVDLLHPQKSGAAVLVAVERKSRLVLLAKQAGKQAAAVSQRLLDWFEPLPAEMRRTLTQDNGTEFAMHYKLNQLGMATYFCAPHQPWQKGSVENMNGRLRRYIPLGTPPCSFSDEDMQALASRLNHTPRKCLGFKTPAEVFLAHLNPLHLVCVSTFPLSRE